MSEELAIVSQEIETESVVEDALVKNQCESSVYAFGLGMCCKRDGHNGMHITSDGLVEWNDKSFFADNYGIMDNDVVVR
jgi:hypothetical protein